MAFEMDKLQDAEIIIRFLPPAPESPDRDYTIIVGLRRVGGSGDAMPRFLETCRVSEDRLRDDGANAVGSGAFFPIQNVLKQTGKF